MRFLTLLALIFVSFGCSSHKRHWDYYGVDSPDHWAEIDANFHSCSDGTHQSPIDLSLTDAKEIPEKIEFHYHDSKTKIIDNGHTIKAEIKEKNYIIINKVRYDLLQLHFHTHSEHSLEGVYYPLEVHLVHKAKSGQLAVLGFFIDIDNKEEATFHLFEDMPDQEHDKSSHINLDRIVANAGGHFYYEGSLTTPPCSENVHWVIFDKHLKLDKNQVQKFKAIYKRNYRPVQKVNDRKVFHSSI